MQRYPNYDDFVHYIHNDDKVLQALNHSKFSPDILTQQDNAGWTLLMISCKYNYKSAQHILNHPYFTSDMLNAKSNAGSTPLMIACKYNHKSVQCILNHPYFTPDMFTQQDNARWTPLMIACEHNDQSVQYILNHPHFIPDMLNVKNNDGWTPLMIACQHNHQSIQCILNNSKFSPDMLNFSDDDGWTAFVIACQYNHQSAECILDHDTFIPDMLDVKDDQGWTPLMIACQFIHDCDLIKKIISMCSIDILKSKCNKFNINTIKTNNPMKKYAANGGQTFLHILAIFNSKIFFEIKNIMEFDLLNIVDNSGLVCSHYVSSDTMCLDTFKLSCPICLDKSDDTYIYNPCGHTICGNCSKSYNKSICHMCKSHVSSKTKIYL